MSSTDVEMKQALADAETTEAAFLKLMNDVRTKLYAAIDLNIARLENELRTLARSHEQQLKGLQQKPRLRRPTSVEELLVERQFESITDEDAQVTIGMLRAQCKNQENEIAELKEQLEEFTLGVRGKIPANASGNLPRIPTCPSPPNRARAMSAQPAPDLKKQPSHRRWSTTQLSRSSSILNSKQMRAQRMAPPANPHPAHVQRMLRPAIKPSRRGSLVLPKTSAMRLAASFSDAPRLIRASSSEESTSAPRRWSTAMVPSKSKQLPSSHPTFIARDPSLEHAMQHYNAVVSDKPTKLKVVVKRARNLWHPLSEPNPKVPKSCEVSAKVWIGNDECMSQFTPEKTLTFHGMNADVKFENPAWNCAMLFDITSLKPTENTSQDNTVFVQLLNAPLTETSRAIAVCSLTPDGKLVALNSRQSPSTNPKKGRPSFVQIPRAQGSGDSAVADWFLIHEYRGNGPKVVARCEIELMISLESGNDRPAPFEMKL